MLRSVVVIVISRYPDASLHGMIGVQQLMTVVTNFYITLDLKMIHIVIFMQVMPISMVTPKQFLKDRGCEI